MAIQSTMSTTANANAPRFALAPDDCMAVIDTKFKTSTPNLAKVLCRAFSEADARFVVIACSIYDGSLADLRQDLTDARNGWEAATSEVHELYRLQGLANEVGEQLLDAAKAAEAVLTQQKWLDYTTAPESVALAKLRAAIAAAGAA